MCPPTRRLLPLIDINNTVVGHLDHEGPEEDTGIRSCIKITLKDAPYNLVYPAISNFGSDLQPYSICNNVRIYIRDYLDNPMQDAAEAGLIPHDEFISSFSNVEPICTDEELMWCPMLRTGNLSGEVKQILQMGSGMVMANGLCKIMRGAYGFISQPDDPENPYSPPGTSVICQEPARAPFPNCK